MGVSSALQASTQINRLAAAIYALHVLPMAGLDKRMRRSDMSSRTPSGCFATRLRIFP